MALGNDKLVICFDVDGTLINIDDTPRYDVINILKTFSELGCTIVVWSGGGVDYAYRWAERLGLLDLVSIKPKGSIEADLCFDDEECTLARVAVRV